MRRLLSVCFAAGILAGLGTYVAAQVTNEPYKLGTFRHQGRTFVGVVVRDRLVADLARASAALEPAAAKVVVPATLKGLIERYAEPAVHQRLRQIAAAVAGSSGGRPAYVYELTALDVLPPIRPDTILNAAINYQEHAQEMTGRGGVTAAAPTPPPEVLAGIPGLWQRKSGDPRHNPYLFIKPTSAVVGDGDAIRIPPGRDRVDWECELAIVVGQVASRVPIERAPEYIFGYTLENDISDRGGRLDGRHGSDWLIGKGHDTFAPLGPFLVPKEFVKDPQKLAITFTLSGKVMQDSGTDRMTHDVAEMLSFASHILTLRPGDVISTGSPAGVGTARETPIYMKAGDLSVCTIESIGTLTNPVVGLGPAPTGARAR